MNSKNLSSIKVKSMKNEPFEWLAALMRINLTTICSFQYHKAG